MSKARSIVAAFLKGQDGTASLQYGILVGLVGVAALAGAHAIGPALAGSIQAVTQCINSAGTAC